MFQLFNLVIVQPHQPQVSIAYRQILLHKFIVLRGCKNAVTCLEVVKAIKNQKSKDRNVRAWVHLPCRMWADNPPSPVEKAELINAGLGPRKLSLFESGDSWEFHKEIMFAFPKLSEGGYELMRTQPNNNRELCAIPSKSGEIQWNIWIS